MLSNVTMKILRIHNANGKHITYRTFKKLNLLIVLSLGVILEAWKTHTPSFADCAAVVGSKGWVINDAQWLANLV